MKRQLEIMFIFSICLMLIPCIAFINPPNTTAALNNSDTVKILFTEIGKTEEITMNEYMIGAVLAQMPADFNEEALKAQAVLAHTYILRRQLTEAENPTDKLNGADISDDTALYQSYFTTEQAKAFYKDDFENSYNKVKNAVDDVKDQILTYDSEPIIVAFHAVSSGKTQSAKDMWNEDIPYLTTVDSSWDEENAGFESKSTMTADEITARLSSAFSDKEFKDINNNLKIKSTSESGAVLETEVCGNIISGSDFAAALSLPSPCFEINQKDGNFEIITKGCGHLVGMSQFGANSMAQKGKTYQEILSHYFPGTSVDKNC